MIYKVPTAVTKLNSRAFQKFEKQIILQTKLRKNFPRWTGGQIKWLTLFFKGFQALIKSVVKSQGFSRNQGRVGTLDIKTNMYNIWNSIIIDYTHSLVGQLRFISRYRK